MTRYFQQSFVSRSPARRAPARSLTGGRLGSHFFASVLTTALASVLLVAGCGANAQGDISTETGNPPLLASDRISVTPNADPERDGVTVAGLAGAVAPGGAEVQIRNQTNGESTTVTSDSDGSFSASIEGNADDEYSVRAVDGSTTSTELNLATTTDPRRGACQKICAGPRECGSNETLMPISGCDCDGSVCECSEQECVARCLSDMDEYDSQGASCAEAAANIRACIMAAPCETIASRDEDAIRSIAECEPAFEFEGSCAWAGRSNQCSGSSSGSASAGEGAPRQCEVIRTCGTTNYGLSCDQLDDGTYDCTCRQNGLPNRSFYTTHACDTLGSTQLDETARQMRWYCGYPITLPNAVSSSCAAPSYEPGDDDSPGACSMEAQCDAGTFAVNCTPEGAGIECTCTRDGAPQASVSLDADGCLSADGIHDDGPESRAHVLSALGALCEADLQLQ